MPDVLHFGVIKLLGCLFHDPAVVLNLYYLLPFPLTALSSYFVLRRLRLGRLPALVASVLYICLPYHLTRFHGHLFLSAYYLLPLMILLIVCVGMGRHPFLRPNPDGVAPRWRFLTWEAVGAAGLCVLSGLNGAYYAFFFCFFLLAAGARAAFRDRKWAPMLVAGLLMLLTAASLGAALAPTFLGKARDGANPETAARSPGEADLFGLSISEMLLPTNGHCVPVLARLRDRYQAAIGRRPTGEEWSEPLGVVGAAGFLWLFGRFLLRRRGKVERVEDQLAFLNAAAVGLGTVGGFGACFAFFVSPMIRCYNRISIFIAFFALAGLFLALHRLAAHSIRGRWGRLAFAAGLASLLVLGLWDETSPRWIPNYALAKKEYADDAEFGQRVEAVLPAGAMVYQLPYMPFPENGPLCNLADYDLLRPYFHTRTLRFSYGAMKGRDTSRWQATLAHRPLPQALEQLALSGFSGVYVDRSGFADGGTALEAELSRLLGVEPMVSRGGGQTFFDMTAYTRAFRARFPDEAKEARRATASQSSR